LDLVFSDDRISLLLKLTDFRCHSFGKLRTAAEPEAKHLGSELIIRKPDSSPRACTTRTCEQPCIRISQFELLPRLMAKAQQ